MVLDADAASGADEAAVKAALYPPLPFGLSWAPEDWAANVGVLSDDRLEADGWEALSLVFQGLAWRLLGRPVPVEIRPRLPGSPTGLTEPGPSGDRVLLDGCALGVRPADGLAGPGAAERLGWLVGVLAHELAHVAHTGRTPRSRDPGILGVAAGLEEARCEMRRVASGPGGSLALLRAGFAGQGWFSPRVDANGDLAAVCAHAYLLLWSRVAAGIAQEGELAASLALCREGAGPKTAAAVERAVGRALGLGDDELLGLRQAAVPALKAVRAVLGRHDPALVLALREAMRREHGEIRRSAAPAAVPLGEAAAKAAAGLLAR